MQSMEATGMALLAATAVTQSNSCLPCLDWEGSTLSVREEPGCSFKALK